MANSDADSKWYNKDSHDDAINEMLAADQASTKAVHEVEQQTMKSLNGIYDEVKGINDRIEELEKNLRRGTSRPSLGPTADALRDGLEEFGVTDDDAAGTAAKAADEIRKFAGANDSDASNEDVARAVRGLSPDQGGVGDYADAVRDAVRDAVLDPGRNLPHDLRHLDEAHRILASAKAAAGSPAGVRASAPGLATPPPTAASSEVMRDVSHLTTLLLGSSPAFAEAMRVQSDAIAYSLAALNKVGDMQRQDALGLAITARAAASKFE